MRFPQPLLEGSILRRVSRFVVEVETSRGTTLAQLANSGRLREAHRAGVRLLAYCCSVSTDQTLLADLIPVRLF